jgi:hypothetical protein
MDGVLETNFKATTQEECFSFAKLSFSEPSIEKNSIRKRQTALSEFDNVRVTVRRFLIMIQSKLQINHLKQKIPVL